MEEVPQNTPAEMLEYYNLKGEVNRLAGGNNFLELVRTQEIIQRYLPAPPATILDVGGGPGVYAGWLARLGYEVHLLDPVPLHIEQGRQLSAAQPATPLTSMMVADARELPQPDESVDAILLLGPLYHLTEQADRLQALREARRVLRPGGWLFSAAISRFASAMDGLFRNLLQDLAFYQIVQQDLVNGQHRNPTGNPAYFTTTYFHHPANLSDELSLAGLPPLALLGVEGPGWLIPDFAISWNDPVGRSRLLDIIRRLESEPTLLGLSAHLLGISQKAYSTAP